MAWAPIHTRKDATMTQEQIRQMLDALTRIANSLEAIEHNTSDIASNTDRVDED
jgi:hypothetical protein